MTQPARHALNRRSFTLFCGSVSVAVAFGASLSEAPELEPFRKLSADLTGFPIAALDPQSSAQLLQALVEVGRGEELKSRLQAPGSGFSGLETEIIAAWYSGVLPAPLTRAMDAPGEGRLLTQGALIWAALGFAGPPGVCGAPQDWSKPPLASA